jgi:hypothetical protein
MSYYSPSVHIIYYFFGRTFLDCFVRFYRCVAACFEQKVSFASSLQPQYWQVVKLL